GQGRGVYFGAVDVSARVRGGRDCARGRPASRDARAGARGLDEAHCAGVEFCEGERGGTGEVARGADAVADAWNPRGPVGGAVSSAGGKDALQGRVSAEEELSAAGIWGEDPSARGRGEKVFGGV